MRSPSYQIQLIYKIVWKDMYDNIIDEWPKGTILDAYNPPDQENPKYYVTAMGGIWADEAIKIN